MLILVRPEDNRADAELVEALGNHSYSLAPGMVFYLSPERARSLANDLYEAARVFDTVELVGE